MQDDVTAMNNRRLETLRLFKEEVDAENQLWDQYFAGDHSAAMGDKITRQKERARRAYEAHERARQAMYDAGYIKPTHL